MGGSRLREYLNGYIIVRAECLNPEKFINMSARYGIKMWDIQRINFTTIEFKMKYYQYRQLKNIIRKTKSKTKIMKKYGVNFAYNKAIKRKFFLLGILFFLGIIFYLSSIVWKIEIEGNKKIEKSKIYQEIKKAGLSEGKIKYNINLRDVENSVLKEINEISIINIKFNGTKAKVNVVERTMPPEIPIEKPANIVASKEGIVTKILSYKGQPEVKVGDYVRGEQVLISGVITDSNKAPLMVVHAMGEVIAKTWYESIQEINLDYKYEVRTGRVREKLYLVLMGKKICIKNDNIDFEKYDKIEEKTPVKINKRSIPVVRISEYYFEKKLVNKKLNFNDAINIAINKAEEELKGKIPQNPKIIDKKIEKFQEGTKAKVKILYIAEENIGTLREIK
jgi:similar to stage IV sporulation protein